MNITDRGQTDPLVMPSPGLPGAFGCLVCGSPDLVVGLAVGEDAYIVELVCRGCLNRMAYRIEAKDGHNGN